MSARFIVFAFLFASAANAADSSIDRWAKAVGGREKVAAVKAIYREATIDVAGYQGSIKAWHTCDGKYQKEEQVGMFSTIETFDGTDGTVQRGSAPPQKISAARATPFANWNSVFFAFFPERRHGNVAIEDDGTIVLEPEGGIAWRITLDPQTSLPKTMIM